MRQPEYAEMEDSRVHILRDGHMLRGSEYGTVYAVSITTEGFRLPDRALHAIRTYIQRYEPKDGRKG